MKPPETMARAVRVAGEHLEQVLQQASGERELPGAEERERRPPRKA
jgi:hypothetical protein